MGLQILAGGAGTGKSRRCYEEIVDYVEADTSHQAVLIVPDQDTHTAEYAQASLFPSGGFTRVRVTGFHQLAHAVFYELHAGASGTLSPVGEELMIRRILSEEAEEFSVFAGEGTPPRMEQALSRVFNNMDNYSVDAASLDKAAGAVKENPELSEKLTQLSSLYRKIRKDAKGTLAAFAEEIPKSTFLKNAKIWIDGFHSLPPVLLAIVKSLAGTAQSVTVTVPLLKGEEKNPYFLRPAAFYESLIKIGKEPKTVWLTKPMRFKDASLSALSTGFFSFPGKACPQKEETKDCPIRLSAFSNPMAEAQGIAREIGDLVRNGARYRDMTVLLADMDGYADLLERAFHTYGIPFFLDRKEPMAAHGCIRFLRSMVRFLMAEEEEKGSGWQQNLLFSMLKTGLFKSGYKETDPPEKRDAALTAGHIAKLENYVLQFGIGPGEWHKEWDYRIIRDIDSEPPAPTPGEESYLKSVNAIRKTFVTRMDTLTESWSKAKTGKERCAVFYEWLTRENSVPFKLALWDGKDQRGPHFQVWSKFLGLLDNLAEAEGDEPVSAQDFLSVLDDGLLSLTFSSIPPTLDHVTVTSISRGYNGNNRFLFLPGLLEGTFPKRVSVESIFPPEEMEALDKAGFHLEENRQERTSEENFLLYLALTRESDRLYLSYPTVTDDARKGVPASLLTRLHHLGYTKRSEKPDLLLSHADLSTFQNPRQALSLLPLALGEAIPDSSSLWTGLKNWAGQNAPDLLKESLAGLHYENKARPLTQEETDALLYKDGSHQLKVSISQLQNYRRCPYRYFLENVLSLRERDKVRLGPNEIGNYIHGGLHLFTEYLKGQGKDWKDATDDEIKNKLKDLTTEMAPRMRGMLLTNTGAGRFMKEILDNTLEETIKVIRRMNSQSRFRTEQAEKEFSFTLANGVTVKGKIDRYDTWKDDANKDFVSIWDYKTGKEEAKLDEMRLGIKLQLPTYALALGKESPGCLPAALLYLHILPLKIRSIKAEKIPVSGTADPKPQDDVKGYYLEDTKTWKALDEKAGTAEAYVNKIFNNPDKIGNMTPAKANTHRLDYVQMENLMKQADGHLGTFSDSIMKGEFPIKPYLYRNFDGCAYCPFTSVCRFDPSMEGEDYDKLAPMDEKEVMSMLEKGTDATDSPAASQIQKP